MADCFRAGDRWLPARVWKRDVDAARRGHIASGHDIHTERLLRSVAAGGDVPAGVQVTDGDPHPEGENLLGGFNEEG